MKKSVSVLAIVLAMFGSTTAKAQLVTNVNGYQRAEVSYIGQKNTAKLGSYSSDTKTKGFELGYIKGISLVQTLPLFLELGGNLTWSHGSDTQRAYDISIDDDHLIPELSVTEVKCKYTFMSVAIPVNVAYKFAFVNSENFTIVPFVGPNFKFNFIGKTKFAGKSISNFDKDNENPARRFQVGLNLGLGVNICDALYVGYKFQPDFTRYVRADSDNYAKTSANYFTIGINF
ncbi:MAG: PorT family protein [Bacteroidales bacterium]|nr:PorT family protein [Bacteroidales bacterium]